MRSYLSYGDARVSQLVRAKISALGTYVPPRVLSNADLEKMVETSNDWILERTGIRERHLADKGVATSDLAVEAARKALVQRGIPATDLEAILVATVTPDMFFPSTACLVQHKLGASGVWGFDLSAACSAFLYALQTGAQYISTGMHKKVMVIGSDVMSSIIDYTDRATCVIFGDGAGAVILEPAEEDGVGLIDYIHEVDGSGGNALYMPGGGSLNPSSRETVEKKMHYVHQDGQAVFKFAVRKQTELCEKLLKRNNLKGCDIDAFIPHQANRRIITATADRLGLRPESLVINIDRFGNTTAGTIPLAMQTAVEEGKLKKGSLVMLASVGAGFTVGATLLRWAY
ncbi:MAG: 3-oxoacyl-ACP synthase [Acidobacteria bacterium]|nr:MAG: 3-oxoacyl-ACP synthase [Acidobacteriota bacterium]PYX42039.1 MAG: 3-oxoacyl-ACP synthase [Acidobacteriota bacterium]